LLVTAAMRARLALADADSDSLTFGARMRSAREQRRISIAAVAETTKILGALIEGLERDDVSRWPAGFYGRAFIRAYATAIGVDPEATVREFLVAFPDPEATEPRGPAVPAVERAGVTVSSSRLRCVAVAVDWFVLCVMALALYAALGSVWAPLSIAAAIYYGSGVILLGNSPGLLLVADEQGGRKTRSSRGRAMQLLSFLRDRLFSVSRLRALRSVRSS
jgi:transcriptional regulator with XRE-family HTH domain